MRFLFSSDLNAARQRDKSDNPRSAHGNQHGQNSISTQLGVQVSAMAGTKAYHVQFSADGGKTWLDVGIWPNTKGIVITNLTPGTVYSVRIRAIGGSTQYSPWSATISKMAT